MVTAKCGCNLSTLDDENLPQCELTWNLLATGKTKGIFQLESNLGNHWTKTLQPTSQEHLSALVAILRPACLKAIAENGHSMTYNYCERKNKKQEVPSFHPVVDKILESTYGVLCYQEQVIELAKKVAGFSGAAGEQLRKGIGKKLADEIAKSRVAFLEGAEKEKIITKEQATQLFDWIERGSRYTFNRAHSYSYSRLSYDTAYLKAHFPAAFFANWLYYAKEKADSQLEICELVEDAKSFGVKLLGPDIRHPDAEFSTDGVVVRFGYANVKGVGPATAKKIPEALAMTGKSPKDMTWMEFLLLASPKVGVGASKAMISVGAFDYTAKTRTRMLNELNAFSTLTDKEAEGLREVFRAGEAHTLPSLLKTAARPKKEGGVCANKNRVSALESLAKLLDHPPASEEDGVAWIAATEQALLGAPITVSHLSSCDISHANTTLKEFNAGKSGIMLVAVRVKRVKKITTKTSKEMVFATFGDDDDTVEAVIFAETLSETGHLVFEGNKILVSGKRDNKKGSFVVEKVYQL